MNTTNTFVTAKDVMEILGVSKAKAYRIVQQLNAELKEKGYMVIQGRVSRKYFNERFYEAGQE